MGSNSILPSKEAARRGKVYAHISNAQQLVTSAVNELECAGTYGDPDNPDPNLEYALDHLKSAALAVDGLHQEWQRKDRLERAFPIR